MKSRFLLALLSVSALVPTAAMAQSDPEQRGPRGRERIERSPGGETPGARAEFRNDIRVEAPQPRPERPRIEERRSEPQPGGDAPRWQGRGDRGDRGGFDRRDPPRDTRGQIDRESLRRDRPQGDRPDRGWQRPDRPDRVERRDPPRDAQGQIDREALRRDWPRADGRGVQERREQWRREQWRREQGERDRWDRGTEWDRGNRDWNRGGDWNRGDRDGNRGGWDRNRGGWDRNRGGGQWDRGWRRDDRYDWNRYRQQNRNLYRLPRYYAPQGWGYGYRRFGVGVTLNSFLFGSNYWINDPYSYRLPEVWGPYRWVRYYNDALLVDVRSGQVVDVEYDIFW
ncbi:RcnB family protein [Sphingomonas sp. 2R-10]|uniref:RcnB family protein n=1 Tax=Sphingomonas sp. 2R-10 TaxID=3045148 RepID=UPI000F793920|nr:RcnB family protein [Sphingomonas sp. 2R-10]MDJ0277056.1 RcnB family protein [Sphingomonas sp. 2R-10]